MTSRGILTNRTVYRRGGQLALVIQYDVFFSCFVCIVCRERGGERKMKGVWCSSWSSNVVNVLCFCWFIKFLNGVFFMTANALTEISSHPVGIARISFHWQTAQPSWGRSPQRYLIYAHAGSRLCRTTIPSSPIQYRLNGLRNICPSYLDVVTILLATPPSPGKNLHGRFPLPSPARTIIFSLHSSATVNPKGG